MIFVTVGTHEQPFDRLLIYMDRWAEKHDERVVMQTGYTDFRPCNCDSASLFDYEEMEGFIKKARIVISHGGPSTFMLALRYGKVPVVVPRQSRYKEHVNDHQLLFCRELIRREKPILVVEDVHELKTVIKNYDRLCTGTHHSFQSHNTEFCRTFERLAEDLADSRRRS